MMIFRLPCPHMPVDSPSATAATHHSRPIFMLTSELPEFAAQRTIAFCPTNVQSADRRSVPNPLPPLPSNWEHTFRGSPAMSAFLRASVPSRESASLPPLAFPFQVCVGDRLRKGCIPASRLRSTLRRFPHRHSIPATSEWRDQERRRSPTNRACLAPG